MALLLALTNVSGNAAGRVAEGVTADEQDQIVHTLTEFYAAMEQGQDYEAVRDRFLSADYFIPDDLTLETLDYTIWRPVFDNTLALIQKRQVWFPRQANVSISQMCRRDNRIVVTQIIDIPTRKAKAGAVSVNDEGNIVIKGDPQSGESFEDCSLVKSLKHDIVFVKEDGAWRIAQFDDGISLKRMDTNNPYGPIFLLWVNDLGPEVTPFGAFITKILPREEYPERPTNIAFHIAEE